MHCNISNFDTFGLFLQNTIRFVDIFFLINIRFVYDFIA